LRRVRSWLDPWTSRWTGPGEGGDLAANLQRAIGSLDGAAGLGAGDHVCWTYQSEEERRRVLTEFFAEGAARGDQLVYWALEDSGDPQLEGLRGARNEVDAFIETGRLVIQPARDVYAPGGTFDPTPCSTTSGS
jgi:hypothetical protein